MRAILTVVGNDKTGIIYAVSKELAEMNVNIEDISQTIMEGCFTMMMMVDLENAKCDFATIKNNLDKVGEKTGVTIRIQHEDIFNAMHRI